MRDDEFEWDDDKALRNERKHDVSFWTARLALADPWALDVEDPDPDEGVYAALMYVVNYTDRGRRIRIISARRATNYEQNQYYNQ